MGSEMCIRDRLLGCASFSFGQALKTKSADPQEAVKQHVSTPSVERKALPSDFPVMVDTGNREADKEKYAKSKAKWVAENPKRYSELTKIDSEKQ